MSGWWPRSCLAHNENTSTLELDDGSGRTDGRYWSHAEDTEAGHNEAHFWQAGAYVRIVGNIRRFKTSTTNSLVVLSVQPIIDHNEFTFHMLEAICVHLENLRAAQPSYGSYAPMQTNTYAQNPYVAATGPSDDGLDSLSDQRPRAPLCTRRQRGPHPLLDRADGPVQHLRAGDSRDRSETVSGRSHLPHIG